MFDGIKSPKELGSIKKNSGYKPAKCLWKWLIPENYEAVTEEWRISVSTVSRVVKKMRGKRRRRSRKPLLNGAMVQKRLERSTRLLNDLKNHGNLILIFPMRKLSPFTNSWVLQECFCEIKCNSLRTAQRSMFFDSVNRFIICTTMVSI